MKKFIFGLLFLTFSALFAYYGYFHLSGKSAFTAAFASGIIFGIFLMYLRLNVKNNKINSYKRELEKESILSDENSARVKVLESKIEVLEKALENAINWK